MRNLTLPLPAPDASDNWIHGVLAVAVHAQSALACTAMASLRPAAAAVIDRVETTTLHARGSCRTAMRRPSIISAPSRGADAGFSAALKLIVADPCPVTGDTLEIHSDPLDAVHPHSGDAVTLIADDPPAASTADGDVTLRSHDAVVGLVGDDLEELQPDSSAALIAPIMIVRSDAREIRPIAMGQ